ncbi:unnamed protein product [Sympodiomycopsis kandeliae]
MGRRKPTSDGERYYCNYAGCGKSYTRADHLSRHQLNHGDSSKTLSCNQCNRTFVRPDLLARHQQRHVQWQRGKTETAQGSTSQQQQRHRSRNRNRSRGPSLQHLLNRHEGQGGNHEDEDEDDDDEDSEGSEDSEDEDGSEDGTTQHDITLEGRYNTSSTSSSIHTSHLHDMQYRPRKLPRLESNVRSGGQGQHPGSSSSASYYPHQHHSSAHSPLSGHNQNSYPTPTHPSSSSSAATTLQGNNSSGDTVYAPLPTSSSTYTNNSNTANNATTSATTSSSSLPPLFDSWPDLNDPASTNNNVDPMTAPPPLSGHQTPSLAGLQGLSSSTANFSDFSWLFDGIEPSAGGGDAASVAASNARSEHTNSASGWSLSPDTLFLQPSNVDYENMDELGELQRAIDQVPLAVCPGYNIESVAHHRLLVFLQAIPDLLKSPFFTPPALRLYLHLFFTHFNSVYPMIHQPTFSANSTDPSLLAAAIMIGTFFSVPSAYELAVRIAQKMWSAMLNLDDFRPTRATLPMLQAMVLTEFFAKTMATRPHHEMAHLFHSFMVTLARRNALFINQHRSQVGTGSVAWRTWAREEERKRVTFFLFILDSEHATVFGHAPVVSAFEIQLQLPCSQKEWNAPNSEAWEVVRLSGLNPPLLFIAAVKARLQRCNTPGQIPTDSFMRLLLLHGLMSVGFDLKWKQHSLLDSVDEEGLLSWQEQVRLACSSLREACELPSADATDEVSSMLISITQIMLYVDVLEIMVAAGKPAVLGRVIDRESYRASQQTIHRWAQSRQGPIAVWHAVYFLRASFRKRKRSGVSRDDGRFRCGTIEETLHRHWCEYLSVMVIWAYGYSVRSKTDSDRAGGSDSGTSQSHLQSRYTRFPPAPNASTSSHTSWIESPMPLQGHYANSKENEVEEFLDAMCTKRPSDIVSCPYKSCTRPILEVVEKVLRSSRWELLQEAADLLQRLILHHSAPVPVRNGEEIV